MGFPPRSLDSKLLFNRPISDWISRVDRRRQELDALALNEVEIAALRQLVTVRFVASLAGSDSSPAGDVELLVSTPTGRLTPSPAANALAALREIENLVDTGGASAELSVDLIRRLDRPLSTTPKEFSSSVPGRDPSLVAASVDLACRWFTAESFIELNPVEQAGIALLRLIEIAPFGEGTRPTAIVAASLFTLKSGLPPVIIGHDRAQAYDAAVAEGLRMSTRPMVELIADTLAKTLEEMIRLGSRGRS
jgi:hypothetical protein